MSFFEKNKIGILIGGSVLTLVVGVSFFMKNGQRKRKNSEPKIIVQIEEAPVEKVKRNKKQKVPELQTVQQEEIEESVAAEQSQKGQSKENQLGFDVIEVDSVADQVSIQSRVSIASSKLKVTFMQGTELFDISTITAILESSLDYIGDEFIRFTQLNRAERRKLMKQDQEAYKELVLEYNASIEKFILTAQDQLLNDLSIDKQKFEDSVAALNENGFYQQLFMVQSGVKQALNSKLPRTQKVSKEMIRNIIQFQLEFLTNSQDTFTSMINQLQHVPDIAELIPFVLGTMIQDAIFEKFSIEEEDQLGEIGAQEVMEDPEIQSLLIQIEDAMLNLMGSLGLQYSLEAHENLSETRNSSSNDC